MTKEETVKIMAMLGAFYGAGKSNPEIMAEGWHIILESYDYTVASRAVLKFAKNDTREYASFPTVGNIVKYIEDEIAKEQAPINEVVKAIAYGRDYYQLSKEAKELIAEPSYEEWLKMDAEEFSNRAGEVREILKTKKKLLKG